VYSNALDCGTFLPRVLLASVSPLLLVRKCLGEALATLNCWLFFQTLVWACFGATYAKDDYPGLSLTHIHRGVASQSQVMCGLL
jgi:hypothetical protein